MLVPLAQRLVPGLAADGATRWMGHRPSMPDSVPVIGAAPGVRNAYFAFGHGHLGLTMGAITGKLIAELAGGRPTSIDLTPYRADRF
jgi:D-amino-acid dehydrogenase